jgi:hypothetical protein
LPAAPEFVFRIPTGKQAETGIDKLRRVWANDDQDPVWRKDADYFPGGCAYVGDEFKAAYANDGIEVRRRERHVLGRPTMQARWHPMLREGASDFVMMIVDVQSVQLARVQGEFR